jgi:hypothetical protein
MGLELPGWLTEPLGWIGLIWPQADEEKLFADGQVWITFGSTLRGQAQDANNTAQKVWTDNHGDSINAFEKWWNADDGPAKNLEDEAIAAELIGAGLIAMAAITLALKIAFIVQLVILAVEVAQAIATAFVSFGATTAEIPGFVAATRVICRELINKVVSMVEREIAKLFEKAAKLLEKVGAKDLSKGAGKMADNFLGKSQARAFESLFSKAGRVELGTGKDGAVFYSGEDDAGRRMFDYGKDFADGNGKKVLETTKGGKEFDDMGLYGKDSPITNQQADQIWKRLSSRYGENASGDANVFLHQGNPDRPLSGKIFMKDELPSLKDNPNINSVTVRDPQTGYTRTYTRQELEDLNGDYSSVLPPGSH